MEAKISIFYFLLILSVLEQFNFSKSHENFQQMNRMNNKLKQVVHSSNHQRQTERESSNPTIHHRNDESLVFLRGQQLRSQDEPILSKQEPRWWNPCNKHTFNDTLIKIIISPQNYFPSHIIEFERKERGRFLREALLSLRRNNLTRIGLNSSPTAPKPDRNKRSIITFRKSMRDVSRVSGQLLDEFHDEKSAILLKKPFKGAKKTTFSIEKKYSKDRVKSREYHSSLLDGLLSPLSSKHFSDTLNHSNRNKQQIQQKQHQLPSTTPATPVATTTAVAAVATTTTTTTTTTFISTTPNHHSTTTHIIPTNPEQKQQTPPLVVRVLKSNGMEVDELLKKVFFDDVKVYWYLNRAMNTLSKTKRLTSNIKRLIDHDLEAKNVESVKKFDEVSRQKNWLPDFSQGSHHSESRLILSNTSYYIQYFSCAFEQMVYEQVSFDKRFINLYRDLERATLKVLCDLDNLVIHLKNFNHNKGEYLAEIMNITNLSDFSKKETQPQHSNSTAKPVVEKNLGEQLDNKELKNSGGANIELHSLVNRYSQTEPKSSNFQVINKKHDTISQQSTTNPPLDGIPHVKRDVMPEHQRNLNSSLERLVRDQSILTEFEKALSHYHSSLMNIYI